MWGYWNGIRIKFFMRCDYIVVLDVLLIWIFEVIIFVLWWFCRLVCSFNLVFLGVIMLFILFVLYLGFFIFIVFGFWSSSVFYFVIVYEFYVFGVICFYEVVGVVWFVFLIFGNWCCELKLSFLRRLWNVFMVFGFLDFGIFFFVFIMICYFVFFLLFCCGFVECCELFVYFECFF